ncbi:aspartate carbamoyltransferase catalytic subunit [Candidatus Aquiluna sp. IMCC13023]|uniref:aspartate carbamoyltransferase catalytic subunit n=1 Tax=Candidatus Aquiluna sp. IMCC13023 TaxID=1081644 RepID=UPI0002EB1FB7|nr:aspartate carbamoyltransferase catalytic subunit [Candidatus Aquiluna sp. IMCC13023]
MKHLISIRDLTRDSAVALLDSAQQLSQVNQRTIKSLPALRGKTVVNLFYENSTRTRISFEIAAKRLSADVINFDAQSSSTSKGESLKDTAQTLEALGAAAIIVRHPMSGAAHSLANRGWVSASIINAGDGRHEHPTQALLDAMTIRQQKNSGDDLAGIKVLVVGDIEHSRVARSNMLLLSLLGATVSVAGPGTLVPEGIEAMGAKVYKTFDEALDEKPDVVMMLRVQLERMQKDDTFSTREYIANWSLDQTRLGLLGKETVIMHPGPMNRGLEISNQAANDPRSAVLRQVENGLAVRMAVLHRVLSGEDSN